MCTSMKYLCRSTQNSEEGRAQTAARQMRKKPKRNSGKGEKKRSAEEDMTEGTENVEIYL